MDIIYWGCYCEKHSYHKSFNNASHVFAKCIFIVSDLHILQIKSWAQRTDVDIHGGDGEMQ